MSNVTEHWIKGSDNLISLLLSEDATPLAGVWFELRITISNPKTYPQVNVEILRTGDSDGITFDGGTLTIQPSNLLSGEIAAVEALTLEKRYRVIIRIRSSTNLTGVHFGEADSDDQLYFVFHQPP